MPLEGIPREDENAPVVLAVVVESVVPGHRPNSPASELRIEVVDDRAQLYPAAFERGSELVVQLDYLTALIHAAIVPYIKTCWLLLNARCSRDVFIFEIGAGPVVLLYPPPTSLRLRELTEEYSQLLVYLIAPRYEMSGTRELVVEHSCAFMQMSVASASAA